jgi:predicted phosphoribosyltransferase
MSTQQYRDRIEAGRILAGALESYEDEPAAIVLGLARGGVPVAYEVAQRLHSPFDVFVVRKLGVPGHEELAMGAIASGGMRVLNTSVILHMGISDEVLEAATEREQLELERREALYREGRPALDPEGRIAILVDDGLATGTSMRVAIAAVRARNPARVVVAVPVGAPETCDELRAEADDVVCPLRPANLYAVGMWYQDFGQTTDEEVRALLRRQADSA